MARTVAGSVVGTPQPKPAFPASGAARFSNMGQHGAPRGERADRTEGVRDAQAVNIWGPTLTCAFVFSCTEALARLDALPASPVLLSVLDSPTNPVGISRTSARACAGGSARRVACTLG